MNDIKNWYSMVPIAGLVMILIGWNISGHGVGGKKDFSFDAAKLKFRYNNNWQISMVDSTQPKLIQLDEPKVEVVMRKFKKPAFGLVFSQDAYNRASYKEYMNKEFKEFAKGEVKGHVLDFTYSDTNPKGGMDAFMGRDFLMTQDNALVVFTFTAPAEYFTTHLKEFDDMIGSISNQQ